MIKQEKNKKKMRASRRKNESERKYIPLLSMCLHLIQTSMAVKVH